jgi:hypothetical protein
MLSNRFPVAMERDPILLPELVFEWLWLTRHRGLWSLLGRAASAPGYLTRWAVLEIAVSHGTHGARRPSRRLLAFYERLVADEHPLVRAEAAWLLEEARAGRSLGSPGATPEPIPTFFHLKIALWNYLSLTGRADYDLDLADALARYLRERPIVVPVDLEHYYAGFDTWRMGASVGQEGRSAVPPAATGDEAR